MREFKLLGAVCAILIACLAALLLLRDGDPPHARPVGEHDTAAGRTAPVPVLATTPVAATTRSEIAAEDPSALRSAGGEDGVLRVRVVDRTAPTVGIAGARIEPALGDESVLTEPDGWASLPAPAEEGPVVTLVVAADGFATRELELTHVPPRSEHVVELSSEGTISGWVRTVTGQLPDDALTVLCWRSRRWLSASTIRNALAGRASFNVHTVLTDPADGSFRIRGLDGNQAYRVAAYGPGYWQENDVGPLQPGTDGVLCSVMTLFGAVVRIESHEGRRIEFSPRLMVSGPGWDWEVDGAETFLLLDSELVLLSALYGAPSMAGVRLNGVGTWTSSVMVFARKDGSRKPVSGVVFGVEPPGCEPVEATIELPWLGDGMGDICLRTRPQRECHGTLELGPALEGGPHWSAKTDLILKDVESGRSMMCAVDVFDPEMMMIRGVPCGTYEVRLRAVDTVFVWPRRGSPPRVVHVTSGATAAAGFGPDLTVGAVEIELVDEEGNAYRDTVTIEILFELPDRWSSGNPIYMLSAPYRCALLPPADWAVRVKFEDADMEAFYDMTKFTVLPG